MAFGDFTVTRASTKNILGSAGLYVSVANDVPAFEFNTDGTYRGLLVEPGATNLALQSQAFNEAVWLKSSAGTGSLPVVTANDAVAPDGTTTADLIVFDRGAGNLVADRSIISQGPTVVSATTYTASVFLKAATGADVGKEIAIRGVGGVTYITITLTADWVRYSRTEASVSTTGNIELANRGTFTADNTVSVHIWQAQLETGSVATSPIVTTAGTASRVADSVTLSSASSLIGQTEGTLYVDFNMRNTGAEGYVARLGLTSFNNTVAISRNAAGNVVALVRANGASTYAPTSYNAGVGRVKVALRYKSGDFKYFVNGVALSASSASLAFTESLSAIQLGAFTSVTAILNDTVSSIAIFPTALSDAQSIALTTL
jgi:hypothetical protein